MNPFALRWLWLGLKGNSVTFALLFASFVLGWSLSHWVNVVLSKLGMHWLFALILPVVFFGWLSGREEQFIPDERVRKLWARGLILGSIGLVLLVSWLRR